MDVGALIGLLVAGLLWALAWWLRRMVSAPGKKAGARRPSGRDVATALPVASAREEYAVIHETRCTCGGPMAGVGQKLTRDQDGRPFDTVTARCLECGATREFVFDIGAFFGTAAAGKSHPE